MAEQTTDRPRRTKVAALSHRQQRASQHMAAHIRKTVNNERSARQRLRAARQDALQEEARNSDFDAREMLKRRIPPAATPVARRLAAGTVIRALEDIATQLTSDRRRQLAATVRDMLVDVDAIDAYQGRVILGHIIDAHGALPVVAHPDNHGDGVPSGGGQ